MEEESWRTQTLVKELFLQSEERKIPSNEREIYLYSLKNLHLSEGLLKPRILCWIKWPPNN